jgi:hypothetical protein
MTIEISVCHVHPELEKNVECKVIEESREGINYRCPQCKTEIFLSVKTKKT